MKFMLILFFAGMFCACKKQKTAGVVLVKDHLFKQVSASQSGISFSNDLKEDDEYNILNYLYFYNGGGVAVGDINNDGLPDIYLSSNMGDNKLYLNKGNFKFEDITVKAGVAAAGGWKTGVSMADVNGDGLLDIYVCKVSDHFLSKSTNQLFINNGDNTFTESAKKYGLDFKGYSTQAVFFDYDHDGDLDMFLLNHVVQNNGSYGDTSLRNRHTAESGDRLYRNDGGKFTDVTAKSGIYSSILGYGLGVTIADFNNDGWEDIYVSNDFHENDYLYYNNHDGTFTQAVETSMGHTSRFSMGNDAADINNDGRPDLIVMDMKPEAEHTRKTSDGAEPYDIFQFKHSLGYHYQYSRNTLQINTGVNYLLPGKKTSGVLFSEVGQMAGISATDWSWSSLFFDMDNDGNKDILITNGILKRPNDLDYIKYVSNKPLNRAPHQKLTSEQLAIVNKMPGEKISSYLYKNNGDITFKNMTSEWGLDIKTISNGAAYADFNNDGYQDLIINHINEQASLYKNEGARLIHNHYMKIKLLGKGKNRFGIGAKVAVYSGGKAAYYEQSLVRGFQSSVDPVISVGLGKASKVDSITVVWNDGSKQVIGKTNADITITLKQADSKKVLTIKPVGNKLFADVSDRFKSVFVHHENTYVDFNREPLIPHMLSTQGPKIAVADINGDGLDDYYVCGATGQHRQIYLQTKKGTFKSVDFAVFADDVAFEDVDAKWIDVNGDGKPDLYIVSGGNQYEGNDVFLRDRLYINQGNDVNGVPRFIRSFPSPDIYKNGSCIAVGDFDHDGDIDVFIGSRGEPGKYGVPQTPHLLINDGRGHFTDRTADLAPALLNIGMVTGAVWADTDHNGYPNLIVVGEWMPVTLIKNDKGHLNTIDHNAGFKNTNGWWNTIIAADLDKDGNIDFVAGNWGLNSVLRASKDQPVSLYVNDFNHNGHTQALLTYYNQGKKYLFNSKDELTSQMPFLKKQYLYYSTFAGKTMDEVFQNNELNQGLTCNAYTFSSSVFMSDGKGHYTCKVLPLQAQVAPVFGIIAKDIDGDGITDLVTGGNFYGVGPAEGRYDASMGLFLKGKGDGSFAAIEPTKSGLAVQGETRDIEAIKIKGQNCFLFGRNNEAVKIINITAANKIRN